MAVYKRGKVWWFKFGFEGQTIRESAKTTNKRTAEQIEAARRTQLAKGEVGIEKKKPVPTLAEFSTQCSASASRAISDQAVRTLECRTYGARRHRRGSAHCE